MRICFQVEKLELFYSYLEYLEFVLFSASEKLLGSVQPLDLLLCGLNLSHPDAIVALQSSDGLAGL